MSLKIKKPGEWISDQFVTELEYTPDSTCFNAAGVEHFGSKVLDTCCCDSCKTIQA